MWSVITVFIHSLTVLYQFPLKIKWQLAICNMTRVFISRRISTPEIENEENNHGSPKKKINDEASQVIGFSQIARRSEVIISANHPALIHGCKLMKKE